MCIFIDHDVQLVIDSSAIQVCTRLLLMTMIGTVWLITVMCLYINTAVHCHQSKLTLEVTPALIKRWPGFSSFDPTLNQHLRKDRCELRR